MGADASPLKRAVHIVVIAIEDPIIMTTIPKYSLVPITGTNGTLIKQCRPD